jgi:uncharacterized protein (DUF58 family)
MSKQRINNISLGRIYLSHQCFFILALFLVLFVSTHFMGQLSFAIVKVLFYSFITVTLVDLIILYLKKDPLTAKRIFPNKVLSLSDQNTIKIEIENLSRWNYTFTFIDELPIEFQIFDFEVKSQLKQGKSILEYQVQPLRRGLFQFGDLHFFLYSGLGLAKRKYSIAQQEEIPVYPSIFQMKKYGILSMKKIQTELGVKKLRKLGHSYEFEQIKTYVAGDDVRTINWKATSRLNTLMVNHYQDEKSQQVYFLLDKSRPMNMPFDGLSLVDYAINSALVLANIATQKQDKPGLISFSDKIGSTLKASNNSGQMRKIMGALYNERYRNTEANYELLYQISQKLINRRSLIFLYSNFETMFALERALPHIRRINKKHLLVLIIFENTEIRKLVDEPVKNTRDIYLKTISSKYMLEKQNMVQVLRNYGIQTVFTAPQHLTVNAINKYLELKSRGLI